MLSGRPSARTPFREEESSQGGNNPAAVGVWVPARIVERRRAGVAQGGPGEGAAKRTFNKRCAEIAPLPRLALFTGARQLSGRVPPQSRR